MTVSNSRDNDLISKIELSQMLPAGILMDRKLLSHTEHLINIYKLEAHADMRGDRTVMYLWKVVPQHVSSVFKELYDNYLWLYVSLGVNVKKQSRIVVDLYIEKGKSEPLLRWNC